MALLDFLKKTKKERALQAPEQSLRPVPKANEGVALRPEPKRQAHGLGLRESKTAWRILRQPHVTEKATFLTHLNQYVFRVFDNATKPEVKHAIEGVYGVHVTKVRKVVLPRKKRRRGRHTGWRSGYTKAIVTLKEGEKIEVLPH